MRILVVEDDKGTARFIKKGLSEEGFMADVVSGGEEGLFMATTEIYDLIILDVMLPEINGFEVLRAIRQKGVSTPVLFLTAKDEKEDIIHGLDLGADDYLVKPFNPRELSARVRAVLRRQAELKELEAKVARVQADGPDEEHALSKAEGLRFDHPRRRAWFQGQPLELRPREYDLLHFLAQHRGQVFTRGSLLSHVWGHESYIDKRTVDVHVRRLRSKLSSIAPDTQVILTEWGVGYRLAEDI